MPLFQDVKLAKLWVLVGLILLVGMPERVLIHMLIFQQPSLPLMLDFMDQHFGFNMDETVALMGAHTLGKALPENSGYEGQNGWVTDMFTLGK
jgi:Peroxidase